MALVAEQHAIHLKGEELQEVAGGVLSDPSQGLVLLTAKDKLLPICVLHRVA